MAVRKRDEHLLLERAGLGQISLRIQRLFFRKWAPALVPAIREGGKHHEVPVHHRPRITWPSIWRKRVLSQTSRSFKPSTRNSLQDGQCRGPKPTG
jgi:hypothetical protein